MTDGAEVEVTRLLPIDSSSDLKVLYRTRIVYPLGFSKAIVQSDDRDESVKAVIAHRNRVLELLAVPLAAPSSTVE